MSGFSSNSLVPRKTVSLGGGSVFTCGAKIINPVQHFTFENLPLPDIFSSLAIKKLEGKKSIFMKESLRVSSRSSWRENKVRGAVDHAVGGGYWTSGSHVDDVLIDQRRWGWGVTFQTYFTEENKIRDLKDCLWHGLLVVSLHSKFLRFLKTRWLTTSDGIHCKKCSWRHCSIFRSRLLFVIFPRHIKEISTTVYDLLVKFKR